MRAWRRWADQSYSGERAWPGQGDDQHQPVPGRQADRDRREAGLVRGRGVDVDRFQDTDRVPRKVGVLASPLPDYLGERADRLDARLPPRTRGSSVTGQPRTDASATARPVRGAARGNACDQRRKPGRCRGQ